MSRHRTILGGAMFAIGVAIWAVGLPESLYNAYMIVGFPLLGLLLADRGRPVPELALALAAAGSALVSADLVLRLRLAARGDVFPFVAQLERLPAFPRVGRFGRGLVADGLVYGNLAMQGLAEDRRSMRRITLRTDAYGFRNLPAAAEEPADLVVLGDSFAEGASIEQERRWSDLLAAARGWKAYSLGQPGASPWGELMNLKLELPRLKFRPGARLAWMLYVGNDLDELYYPDLEPVRVSAGTQAWSRFQSFRKRSPVRWLSGQLALAWGLADGEVAPVRWPLGRTPGVLFSQPQLVASRRTSSEVLAHAHYPMLAKVLAETVATARGAGLDPVILLAPAKEQVYGWALPGELGGPAEVARSGFAEVLADHARALEVPFVDLGPEFTRMGRELLEADGTLLYFPDDTHWNEAGNALAAELVGKALGPFNGPG